jgi:hypothetical protein
VNDVGLSVSIQVPGIASFGVIDVRQLLAIEAMQDVVGLRRQGVTKASQLHDEDCEYHIVTN